MTKPIEIPYLDHFARRAGQSARMAVRGGAGVSGLMYANRTESLMERPALRGLACVYSEPFEWQGSLHVFMPGCFTDSLADGHTIDLQLEHDKSNFFGSTRSGLRFVDSEYGLAFEFEPPRNVGGAVVVSLVASGNRTDMSVGSDVLESNIRNLRGHDVRIVTKAKLREISICKEGAVGNAHLRVVDLAEALSLEHEVASGTLRVVGTANETVTKSAALLRTVEGLNARAEPRRVTLNAGTGRPLASWER